MYYNHDIKKKGSYGVLLMKTSYRDIMKVSLSKKIILIGLVLFVLVIGIKIIISNSKIGSFKAEVDEFVTDWDKMALETQKDEKDLMAIDIYNKVLAGDLRTISEKYEQFTNKEKVNEYLEENIDKDMFDYIMDYNSNECERPYDISKELVTFYSNK